MNNDEKAFYVWIGRRIAELRKNRKLKQYELANELGMNRVSILNIEKGKQTPPLYTYYKIAKILGVSYQELLPLNSEHTLNNNDIMKAQLDSEDLNYKDKEIFKNLI